MPRAVRPVSVMPDAKDHLETWLTDRSLGHFVEFRWTPRYDDWLLEILSEHDDTANHFESLATAWQAGFSLGRKDGAE